MKRAELLRKRMMSNLTFCCLELDRHLEIKEKEVDGMVPQR